MSNSFLEKVDDRFEKGIGDYVRSVEFMKKNAAREENARQQISQKIAVEQIVVDEGAIEINKSQIDAPKKDNNDFVL